MKLLADKLKVVLVQTFGRQHLLSKQLPDVAASFPSLPQLICLAPQQVGHVRQKALPNPDDVLECGQNVSDCSLNAPLHLVLAVTTMCSPCGSRQLKLKTKSINKSPILLFK
jgi:hypothetical protein